MNKSIKTTIISMAVVFSVAHAKDISDKCIDELVELPNTKENFNMTSLPKDLATAIVKVQGGAKFQSIPLLGSMLGPGPDNKLTEAGITVGCAKEMPTEPAGIKSLLMKVGLEMGKSAVASKLGVKRQDIPSSVGELKPFAVKLAAAKTGEALGIEASEVPTDIKGMENLISDNIKNQAAKKLGVEKSSIPNDKSELSGFIKKTAKAKIAKEMKIKPDEVNLSRASLAEYAKEEESLAPVANLVNAANILEVLGLVNGLSAFTGGGNGDGSTSAVAVAKADDYEDEKPQPQSQPQQYQQQQYQQQQAQYQPQQGTNINQQEKVQSLIKRGVKRNKQQIQQESFYLSPSEKNALFEQNKKKGAAGWAGLDFGVGFGIGSYIQGDMGFGIAQSVMDGVSFGLIFSALSMNMQRKDCYVYNGYSSYEDENCLTENESIEIMQIAFLSISLPILVTSRIMALIRPFSFQKKYNRILREALNVNGNVSYSINPLIVPKSSGMPALGLAFNLRY